MKETHKYWRTVCNSLGNGRIASGTMRVIMIRVDVTDVTRNFTSDDWDKFRACGGRTHVCQGRELLNVTGGRGGGCDNRGGRGGRGGRSGHAGHHNDRPAIADERNVAAANVTETMEYDASTSNVINCNAIYYSVK